MAIPSRIEPKHPLRLETTHGHVTKRWTRAAIWSGEMVALTRRGLVIAAVGTLERTDLRIGHRFIAGITMPHKLIVNRGHEEQVHEFEAIEEAFDAAVPFIMDGFIARMTDNDGVVKYTQALTDGQIATYPGDATATQTMTDEAKAGDKTGGARNKPWWKFW